MRRLVDLGVADWIEAGRAEVRPVLGLSPTLPASCPSYPQWENAVAFAYRDLMGELVYCATDMILPFHKRESVRHYGPCVTSRCIHWSGHCNLGAALSQAFIESEAPVSAGEKAYLSCRVQTTCRWKIENGESACRACANVDYFVSS